MQPFRIDVPERDLEDLWHRLDATRWIRGMDGAGWSMGTDQTYLRALVHHWRHDFDWRAQEARLNSVPQFLAEGAGLRIQVLRASGRNPDSFPLLLLHGWPGSIVQMIDLIPKLTYPDNPGAPSFDVVAASLPGFGYSDPLTDPRMNETTIAAALHEVMTRELGYRRFLVRGCDFGQGVLDSLVADFPESVLAAHISGTSATDAATPPDATPAVRQYLDDVRTWRKSESGYAAQQSTRPDTLSPGLNDSPVGLASWIVEKFRRWSDCDGDVERRFSKDELLTNISLYWFSASIASSVRMYAAPAPDLDLRTSTVPFGFLMSSKDMVPTPRDWMARSYRIDRWTDIDRGGHFLDWEEPELVATDLRAFVRQLGLERRN